MYECVCTRNTPCLQRIVNLNVYRSTEVIGNSYFIPARDQSQREIRLYESDFDRACPDPSIYNNEFVYLNMSN